jgi:hypothetical protein
MPRLYQLANDPEYGDQALWWLVVSDDGEDELAGPFPTREEAVQTLSSIGRAVP